MRFFPVGDVHSIHGQGPPSGLNLQVEPSAFAPVHLLGLRGLLLVEMYCLRGLMMLRQLPRMCIHRLLVMVFVKVFVESEQVLGCWGSDSTMLMFVSSR